MPELPEVETVRDGLARHGVGASVREVEVLRDYSVRRHDGGAASFAAQLRGRTIAAAARRGKFLWFPLTDSGDAISTPAALVAHLGMSGQLLVHDAAGVREHPHLRVRLHLAGASLGAGVLDFVDQRTFGHLAVADLAPTCDGGPGGAGTAQPAIPESVAHIARDLLDPMLTSGTPGRAAVVAAMRRRRTGVKRALLDQSVVSGIGNIYADEALWRARLHYARATDTLRATDVRRLLGAAEEVMREALAAGGTSFDALYVGVDAKPGYFARSLAVYGCEGDPCPRCGTPVVREPFMNRSAYRCPRCQPRPRGPYAR